MAIKWWLSGDSMVKDDEWIWGMSMDSWGEPWKMGSFSGMLDHKVC
jgi:hypothetical protein